MVRAHGRRAGLNAVDVLKTHDRVELAGYAESALPVSPPAQTLVMDDTRAIPAWWDGDHYEWPSFVDDVLTTPQTVANTTTRTTVFDPGINAGSLVQGRVYQLDLMGQFSTANTSAQFTVDINLGGADVAGVQNAAANVNGAPWSIEFTLVVRSDGTSGEVKPHTRGLFNSNPDDEDSAPVTVDTTTVTEFSVDLTWSEADPDNSVTLGQAHLKQMA